MNILKCLQNCKVGDIITIASYNTGVEYKYTITEIGYYGAIGKYPSGLYPFTRINDSRAIIHPHYHKFVSIKKKK